MGSLVAAFTVAWTVLMIYVLTLAARQRRLHQSLDQLSQLQAGVTAMNDTADAGAHVR